MAEVGERVRSTCPNCEREQELEVYDIGSGPELACPFCEWCWGVDGQQLQPVDVDKILSYVEEVRMVKDRGPAGSLFVVRAIRSVLSRAIRTPEYFKQARERLQRQQGGDG